MIKKNSTTKNTKKPTPLKPSRARKEFVRRQLKKATSTDEDEAQEIAELVYDAETTIVKKIGYGPRFGGIEAARSYVNKIVQNPTWLKLSRDVKHVELYFYDNKEFEQILKENHGQDKVSDGSIAVAALTSRQDTCAIGLKRNNRQALSHLVILHEMAHIAKAPYDHSEGFQEAYLFLLKEFFPKQVGDRDKIINLLTEEFKDMGLSTRSLKIGKVAPNSKEKLLLDKSKLKKKKSR